jgi:transcriptional regulator GlxA family with amidase domain
MGARTHRVGILLFDQVRLLDVAGPAEVFTQANLHGADYDVATVAASERSARSSMGAIGATLALADAPEFNTVIVPGAAFPRQQVDSELVAAVSRITNGADRIASVCTGTFVLAASGLLNGRRATTHWAAAGELASRYPEIAVDPDAMWVKDESLYSSGGCTAGIDLALGLVAEDHGATLARSVAQDLVLHTVRPSRQSQISAALQWSAPRSETIRTIVDKVIADPMADWSLQTLARATNVSRRHLSRMFRAEMATTPSLFVERVRIEQASALLDEGVKAIEAAARAGFPSYEAMRRAFTKRFGASPTQYRQRQLPTVRDVIVREHKGITAPDVRWMSRASDDAAIKKELDHTF